MEYLLCAKWFVMAINFSIPWQIFGCTAIIFLQPSTFFLTNKLDFFRCVLSWSTFQMINKDPAMVS